MQSMKAQGMSIGVVITAALAVMVLLMVGGFMSGGFGAMTSKITQFVGAGPSAEATSDIAACNSACTTWQSAGCGEGIYFDAVSVACAEDNCEYVEDGTTTCGTCSCNTKTGSWGN